MKFMMMRKADSKTEQGCMPSDELLQSMGEYNRRMHDAGVFVSGEGLRPTSEGYRLTFRGSEPLVTQGPFTETRELLAGFTVLEVDSPEQAIEWARQWPREDVGDGELTLELRRYYELADFAEGEGLEVHRQLDQQLTRQPSGINSYLMFNGHCREALSFYADLLGGRIEALLTHGETPAASEVAADWQDKIIHGCINIGGRRLMGSDAPADHYQLPRGMMVQLEYAQVEQAQQVFEQLAAGGQVQMPFGATFWAEGFGMLTDRFGIGWIINCSHCNGEDS
ncbi:YciI family protein [Marinospirillum alkaliphilum]|uniref:Uncharacterized conserved protein PhnB, glyoxalase superfamily n=1 Tax=Marinospirillum alkaliphilum DSM 21637 TaxID=1122209 RepID=A0A1K1TK29_9GAMM|nr:YciI family protein [Marinospirillum alkaliphilum]SFX00912.1 Uncharacterized conserved protein PhnB, glyoxalase superfamily [Marinospirillum alkaliphilum DSM 21637]